MPWDGDPQTYTDEILQTLIKADELLSGPEKWCKGVYHYNGRFCALGAITEVSNAWLYSDRRERISCRRANAADQRLWAALPSPIHYIAVCDYNDEPETTFEDIKALFQKAIAARRAELVK